MLLKAMGSDAKRNRHRVHLVGVPPNPSFEARPNGKPPRPPGAVVYPTPGGRGALPSVPPQLER